MIRPRPLSLPLKKPPANPSPPRSGFTLVEMLVVIGVIALLLVAVIPAVNSLSKSSGRKAAISNLLGVIEQARAEAIKSGRATYVVFPSFSAGSPVATVDRYNYKSFAIFEEDPGNDTVPKQLTAWKTLPTGVSIRSASLNALPDPAADFTPILTIAFAPDTASTPAFRCLKFNTDGGLDSPPSTVTLTVFEGFVSTAGSEVLTKNPIVTESLTISHLTGRAQHDT